MRWNIFAVLVLIALLINPFPVMGQQPPDRQAVPGTPPQGAQRQSGIQLHLMLRGLMILSARPDMALSSEQKKELIPVLKKTRHSESDIDNIRRRMKKTLNREQLRYIQQLKKENKLIYYSNIIPEHGEDPVILELMQLLRKKVGRK